MTAGGASATGFGVDGGVRFGVGCAEGTITAGTAPAWAAAGGALGSGAAEGDACGEGCATSTNPVSTRAAAVGAGFTASARKRGLDETKNPPSKAMITPTVA